MWSSCPRLRLFDSNMIGIFDDQKLSSRVMASIKRTASFISQTCLLLQKWKSISEPPISKMKLYIELKGNFISREATRVSLN